jgi:hypothetical protein
MKARHIFAGLILAALIAGALVSCDLLGVSISDRVSKLQDDLNTSSRSGVYKNFAIASVSYAALRGDPSPFNVAYPPGPPSFSLSIDDDSDSSAVIVTVSGADAAVWTAPWVFKLDMVKEGTDYVISKMWDAQDTGSFLPTPTFQ